MRKKMGKSVPSYVNTKPVNRLVGLLKTKYNRPAQINKDIKQAFVEIGLVCTYEK